jgi:hypothetical protein
MSGGMGMYIAADRIIVKDSIGVKNRLRWKRD